MSNSHDGDPRGENPAYGPWDGVPYPDVTGTPERSPNARRRTMAIVGAVSVAILAVIAVVAVVIVRVTGSDSTPAIGASETPGNSASHAATGCTHSESSGELPTTDMVWAGGLYFPLKVAPDWRRKAEHRVPNSIDAVSLVETVSETDDMTWIGQVTVGVTNFDPSLSLAEQAELMVKCIVGSELYDRASPRLGEATPTPGRLDGMPTSTIDVPVTVTIADPSVRGDDLLVMIVGTSPSTYFLGSSPIGDTDRRAVVEAALTQLHVSAV